MPGALLQKPTVNTEIINPYYVNMSLSSSNEVEYILMRPLHLLGENM